MQTLPADWTTITSEYSCDHCGRDNTTEVTIYSSPYHPDLLCRECAIEAIGEQGAELLEGEPPEEYTCPDCEDGVEHSDHSPRSEHPLICDECGQSFPRGQLGALRAIDPESPTYCATCASDPEYDEVRQSEMAPLGDMWR